MDYKVGMGQRMREQRKAIRLTQDGMAEQLGISVKHLSEVERGLTGLSIDNLVHAGDILGVSLDYLIKGTVPNSRWDNSLAFLETVPPEKEAGMRDLVRIAVELAR